MKAQGFFTVGSTKDQVLAEQGTPTEFADTEFTYGLSRVKFQNGRVMSWQESPLNRLRAKLLPATVIESKGYFTVGSSKDEVLTVQGSPTEFGDDIFTYGLSRVLFRHGQVVSWEISPLNPLKVSLRK